MRGRTVSARFQKVCAQATEKTRQRERVGGRRASAASAAATASVAGGGGGRGGGGVGGRGGRGRKREDEVVSPRSVRNQVCVCVRACVSVARNNSCQPLTSERSQRPEGDRTQEEPERPPGKCTNPRRDVGFVDDSSREVHGL